MAAPEWLGALRGVYAFGWRLALPLLQRNARLAQGWEQRVRPDLPRADVWVQAASAGEALLAESLAQALAQELTDDSPLRVLATTNTAQGLEVLHAAAGRLQGGSVTLLPALCPLDAPDFMDAALTQVRPGAVVLLEGELWPGLLSACRLATVPLLLVNARMRPRSMARLLALGPVLRALAPTEILAMAEPDALRLQTVFDCPVRRMPNMKFDRVRLDAAPAKSALAGLLPPKCSFVVLGSVRQQEETQVLEVLRGLLRARPKTIVGLFPRHMERLEAWDGLLATAGIPVARRSRLQGRAAPGSVILWDTFGELAQAYALARGAFVGGSLAPLGGQNFLEPLAAGVVPVVGPHLDNFSWAVGGLPGAGLLHVGQDAPGVLHELLTLLSTARPRREILAAVRRHVAARQGGSAQAAASVLRALGRGVRPAD